MLYISINQKMYRELFLLLPLLQKEEIMLERDIERRLVTGVKALGGVAYKFISPGNTGVPDRLVILPGGHVCFAELKTDGGRLSSIQKVQLDRLQALGADAVVVKGPLGVECFLDCCREHLRGEGHEV